MKVNVMHPKVKTGPVETVDLATETVAGVTLVKYTNAKGVEKVFRVKTDGNGEHNIWVNRPIAENTLTALKSKAAAAQLANPVSV